MRAKKSVAVALFAAAALLVVVAGCEGPEGPQGPPGLSPIYIAGRVDASGPGASRSLVWLEVYHTPGVPTVEVNNIPIPFYRGSLYKFYHDDFPIAAGDSAELLVTYRTLDGNPGTAQAIAILPGPFQITCPDTSYVTMAVGDSLVVSWTSSDGADIYLIHFFFGYRWADTSGASQYFRYAKDTLCGDTSITFSQAALFPNLGDIDSVLYGDGGLWLLAIHGPTQPGEQGNVTGDGIGFFNGQTPGGDIDIYVSGSSPLVGTVQEPRNPMQKFMEERAKSLGFY